METTNYRSNIRPPRDLRPAFVAARPMETYRNVAGHTVLCDPEMFEGCGYATADEAAILCALADLTRGRWLEFGAHTGWTAAHLALGGARVVAIDPEYVCCVYNKTGDPARFLSRAQDNLDRAGVADRVQLVGGYSTLYVDDHPDDLFDGVFIDGDHSPPFPLLDVRAACKVLRPGRGIVALHDALGAPVWDAIRWLLDDGWHWRLYRTPQLLAVCWRGDFTPPDHLADASFDWEAWIEHSIKFPMDLLEVAR